MNASKKNLLTVLALAGMLLLVVIIAVYRHGGGDVLSLNQRSAKRSDGSGAGIEVDPEYVIVGGVRRKASDFRPQGSNDAPPVSGDAAFDVGQTQPVALDANPHVKSVVEAIRNKNHPERLTPVIAPKPFPEEAFRENPEAYLNVVEPGRVFQTAQPGPNVPVLRATGPQFTTISQGESVKLRTVTLPRAPVTFTSFDLGRFAENQLTSVTVQADGRGIAEAEFQGVSGTFNRVNILAGSPVASGQIRFVVEVEVPGMNEAFGITPQNAPGDARTGTQPEPPPNSR